MRTPFLTVSTMIVCAVATPAAAQTVTIAPQMVVVNSATRSTSITLANTGTTASEISFSTMYGYPVTDANGLMTLRTFETVGDTMPSVAPWIQIFPQRLRLAPNERRVVRILVAPTAKLSDREYWARLVVSARGGDLPVSGVRDSSSVKVGLALEVRSVLPFYYRNGRMTTGVQIGTVRTSIVDDSLVVRTPLTRTGNAAFVGTLRLALRNDRGKVVSQNSLPLGVFYSLDPRLGVPLRGVKGGKYELLVEAVASRADVPQRLVISAPTFRTTIPVTIP